MIVPTLLIVLIGIFWQVVRRRLDAFESFFKTRKGILVLFAHPDDEVMFFLPTIKKLSSLGKRIVAGCLSTGNADGLGETRKLEFQTVMNSLNIKEFIICDDKRIPDGFRSWDTLVVKELTQSILDKYPFIDTILTFDKGGISGHPNHISTSEASTLRYSRDIKVVQLVSVPTPLKYAVPPFDLVNPFSSDLVSIIGYRDIFACADLMKLYGSQNVWFRRLFTIFSRFAYVNTLKIV